MKRTYLNNNERNAIMVMWSLVQMLEGKRTIDNKSTAPIWETWGASEMMDKEDQKNIKTVRTILDKFIKKKLTEIDKDSANKVKKQIMQFDFRVIDSYTAQKLNREITDKLQYAVMKREDFQDWTDKMICVTCFGCEKSKDDCRLFNIFEDNFVPESENNLPNCPYAYPKEE